MKNRHLTIIGNILIGLSILGMIAIYFPIIQAYFFPRKQVLPPNTSFSIQIPKIGAVAPIVKDVDPWNKEEYLDALSKGVAHAKQTSLPGKDGTMFLFAHSSDAPWRLTRYNTIFLLLGKLVKGDEILVKYEGVEYTYQVTEKKEVWPNEIDSLVDAQKQNEQQNKQMLILQTCTPIGTDLKRLLVYAEKK